MKTFLFAGLFVLLSFVCFAKDMQVKEYYHRDTAPIKPHYRSGVEDNISGTRRSNYQQKKTYQSTPATPTYKDDYENDNLTNEDETGDDEESTREENYSYSNGQRSTHIYRKTKDKRSSSRSSVTRSNTEAEKGK